MTKEEWHNNYRLADGNCSKCMKNRALEIHHKTYHTKEGISVYLKSLEECISENIVEILCRSCHRNEHFAENMEEYIADKMKHSGTCFICNQLAGKGWQRAITYKIDKAICKKCSESFKDKESIKNPNLGNQLSMF